MYADMLKQHGSSSWIVFSIIVLAFFFLWRDEHTGEVVVDVPASTADVPQDKNQDK
jgi:hypothetical protein